MTSLQQHALIGAEAPIASLIALRHTARSLRRPRPHFSRASGAGSRRSRFLGRGLDFAEVRGYQPGDDVRHIDWRVTARTGRVHTRLFQEERERPVLIIADLAPSSGFGTLRRFKSVAIAELTALLLWHTHDTDDRAGAIIHSPAGQFAQRPRHSRNSLLRTLGWLAQGCSSLLAPGEQPGLDGLLDQAVRQARRVARPGTRVVLISDFQSWLEMLDRAPELQAELQQPLRLLARHCQLDAIRVSDRLERVLPPPGHYPVRGGAREQIIDSSPQTQRSAWEARFARDEQRLTELFQSVGGRLLSTGTEDDLHERLQGWW